MTTTWNTIPTTIFDRTGDAQKEANIRRADAKGLEPCELCGRGVANGRGWIVRVIDGGEHLLATCDWDRFDAEATPDERAGDMAYWVLGSECCKTVPNTHREKDEPR
jgi:hypothetical protein